MKTSKTVKFKGLVSMSHVEITDDSDRRVEGFEVWFYFQESWLCRQFTDFRSADSFFEEKAAA